MSKEKKIDIGLSKQFTKEELIELVGADPKCNALGFCRNKPETAYFIGKGNLNDTDEPKIILICKECNESFNRAFKSTFGCKGCPDCSDT